MHRRTPRLLAAAFATALTGTVVLGAALPAAADTDELWTENLRWFNIDSETPYLDDAESAYTDLRGSGVDLPYGWTGDLFDGALSSWTVTDGVSSSSIIWSGVSESVVPDGRSQWNYSGSASAFPGATFAATLEIEGSTVRWVITPTAAPAGLTVSAFGNLGSDGGETVTIVTPNSAVVSSDNSGRDPVIGYWFQGPSGVWTQTSGDGGFSFSFADSGPATVVIAAQDYARCSKQTAIDEMTALVPTLGAQFGLTLDGALGCLAADAPTALDLDVATDQTLALTLDPSVDEFLGGNTPFALASGIRTYFGDPSLVGSAVVGLPDGVTGVIDPTTQTLQLSGTPTESGTFEASAIVYRTDVTDYMFGDEGNGIPLVASVTVTVNAPATVVPAETLPETGPADQGVALALAGGLLLAGGLALAGGMRARRVG